MIEVIMEFDENDNPVVSVKGVKGAGCKTLTSDLTAKLGMVTDEVETPEYREMEVPNAQGIFNRR